SRLNTATLAPAGEEGPQSRDAHASVRQEISTMTKHLSVLDGLRGTAAVSVVMFHFQELSIGMVSPNSLWLRHANLAVDFFFCLSGYVIGYAYDRRREQMGILQFFRTRLIRLHPLVVLGVALGLAAYLFDPFNAGATVKPFVQNQHDAPTWKV